MNAWSVILGLITAVLCGAAARRIAVAKGLAEGNYAALGFFTGPFGLAWTAFKRPMWPGPEEERPDRLAWWAGDARTRPWVVLASLATVAGVVLAIVVVAVQPARISGGHLDAQIHKWLTEQGFPNTTVTCPAFEAKGGYRFLCSAKDDTGSVDIEVTVLNGNGDVTWRLVG